MQSETLNDSLNDSGLGWRIRMQSLVEAAEKGQKLTHDRVKNCDVIVLELVAAVIGDQHIFRANQIRRNVFTYNQTKESKLLLCESPENIRFISACLRLRGQETDN